MLNIERAQYSPRDLRVKRLRPCLTFFECLLQCPYKQMILEGLVQEGNRAAFQSLVAQLFLVMGGNEYHRNWFGERSEPLLHFQTTHGGHMDIENDAVGVERGHRFHTIKELFAGTESLGFHRHGLQQAFKRTTYGSIVIDNGNQRFLLAHHSNLFHDQ